IFGLFLKDINNKIIIMIEKLLKTKLPKISSTAFLVWCFALLCSAPSWGQDGTYTRINSIADLTDGYYVITHNGSIAMTNTLNTSATNNYLEGDAISSSNNQITNPSADIIWQIQTDGTSKTIKNVGNGKYVSYTGS